MPLNRGRSAMRHFDLTLGTLRGCRPPAARAAMTALVLACRLMPAQAAAVESLSDPRHIANGRPIFSLGYADQAYVVRTDDGAWLCAVTTGTGHEGDRGQTIIAMRSTDRGRTWSPPVFLEPTNGPEASYAVLLKVPSGRIYCFYNHNTDNVREVKREDGGVFQRVDSLGHYVFRFTDDHGRSWSPRRYEVPVREFECDRNNVYGGRIRFFWNVGRPLILRDEAILVLHKVGAMGAGFFAQSEGAFLASRTLLTERDPENIRFETRPVGDVGLRAPGGGGRVAEEQSIAALSDGSLVCVYRTIDGWPACAYSRDAGRTWTPPDYLRWRPGGARVKHPRAANFIWRCSNGMFLYWFHNHGGRFIGELGAAGRAGRSPYDDRNPAWCMAGREVSTPDGLRLEWSQPEILLYDDDPFIRLSYPDLIEEEDGAMYITESQKTLARVHEIPPGLLHGLFAQFTNSLIATNGLALTLPPNGAAMPPEFRMPRLPELIRRSPQPPYPGLRQRTGFSLEIAVEPAATSADILLFDTWTPDGRGLQLRRTDDNALELLLGDGRQTCSWRTCRGAAAADRPVHVVATVDGGPNIVMFVVNGVLDDGGDERQFGWGRFSPTLREANGAEQARIGPSVRLVRVYRRALSTSEAVGNWRAWMLTRRR
ncbi:MAG: hypothetical protein N2652_07775 [Kiritimatiellae bacterium]|nr:hypothetical protein [Kiritimatiellia bacterium]